MTKYKLKPDLRYKDKMIEVINKAIQFLNDENATFLENKNDIRSLYKYYLGNTGLTDLNQMLMEKMPNLLSELRYIPKYFFLHTSVEIVDIPANIEIIDIYAFYGCIHLKEINYLGTKKQWDELLKRSPETATKLYNMGTDVVVDIKDKVQINCIDEKNIYKI